MEIKELLNETRLPKSHRTVWLVLYVPFGIVLALFRIACGITFCVVELILPEWDITQRLLSVLACLSLGIITTVKNRHDRDCRVIVGNYVSPLDHLVVRLLTKSIAPAGFGPSLLATHSLGVRNFGSVNSEDTKKALINHVASTNVPLFFQPESHITNGRALLKFKTLPFAITDRVQPVGLSINRPFDLSVVTVGSSPLSNLLWYLFSPYTQYVIDFLPAVPKADLSDSDFAEEVRNRIAARLKIASTSFTFGDVLEWQKKYQDDLNSSRKLQSRAGLHQGSSELNQMVRQVKEVLPAVPIDVIIKDLVKTRSVDTTVTNIVEGRVPYAKPTPSNTNTPSQDADPTMPSTSGTASPSSSSSSLNDDLSTAATSFARSPQERMRSFQERKTMLINRARKRYMDKHGLSAVAFNNC